MTAVTNDVTTKVRPLSRVGRGAYSDTVGGYRGAAANQIFVRKCAPAL
jgi:hypothetical protein